MIGLTAVVSAHGESPPLRCCRWIVVFNGRMISAPTPRFIIYSLFNILYSLNNEMHVVSDRHGGLSLRYRSGICSFQKKYCRGWRPRQPVRPKGLLFYALRHIRDVESPSPTVLQNKLRINKRFYRQSKRCDFSATPLFFRATKRRPYVVAVDWLFQIIIVGDGSPVPKSIEHFSTGDETPSPTPKFINYYLFNIL